MRALLTGLWATIVRLTAEPQCPDHGSSREGGCEWCEEETALRAIK